jgi:dimethylsulfone monooxygenase
MEMFGTKQREHDTRYAFGQEWLDYVFELWGEKGSFTHTGDFFNGENVEAYPKPVQAPRPVLINAGNSRSGVEFSARNVDINFASLDTLENIENYTSMIKDKARTEFSREIKTMTYGLVVARDTEKEAKDAFQRVVDDGDWGAAENVIKIAVWRASRSSTPRRSRSASSPAGADTRWLARPSRSSRRWAG